MKLQIKYLSFFVLIFFSSKFYGQNLTILNGQSLTISNTTDFFVNGLALNPSSDFTINGANSITKSTTALNAQSINRVFTFDNIVSGFQGTLTFFYEDTELNGVTESDLILQSNDGISWSGDLGATLDTNLKTLTHIFGSATNLSSITASASGITLSISKYNKLDIQLYPNPVISAFQITTELSIETLIYNNLGQEVFNSKKKNIDVSQLGAGTYLIIVRDINSNNYNTYQIIKI